jgi:hypothetical protein
MASATNTVPPVLPPGPGFNQDDFVRADALYKTFRAYLEHEDDLINQRSTWHLLIQGFLFATFGALGEWTPQPDRYLYDHRFFIVGIVAAMGLSIALSARRSISAADRSLTSLRDKWDDAKIAAKIPAALDDAFPPLAGGGSDHALQWGKLPALIIPVIIAIAWAILLGLDIYVGTRPSVIPAPQQQTVNADTPAASTTPPAPAAASK